MEGAFWWGRFGVGGILVEGAFWWGRCVGRGGVLVLVEGAFWWSEPFNGWRGRFGGGVGCRGHFGGRNVLVGEVCWWGVFWGWLNGSWWSEAFSGWRGRFGGGGVLV